MTAKEKLIVVAIAVVAYIAVSTIVFRFKNPDLTDTQLFLYFFDALLWK